MSIWAGVVAALLLIPLVLTIRDGNVPNVGWNWSAFDFVFAGTLLFGAGFAYELLTRTQSGMYRIATLMTIATSVVLVWINGAVGIIGNEDGPAHIMYFGVLAVIFLCSIIARFKSSGMMWTLFAAACAQALVPVIALFAFTPDMNETPGIMGVFMLNSIFVALYVGAGLLFRNAYLMSAK